LVTDGINPPVKEEETPGLQAVLDRTRVDTEPYQLSPSDHSMLPTRQAGEKTVGCAI
jgi:hypothetical protein